MSKLQKAKSTLAQIDSATERLNSYQARLIQLATTQNLSLPVVSEQTAEIEACSLSMLQAVEDLLDVTRGLKEAWILGQVHQDIPEVDEEELKSRVAKAEFVVKQLRSLQR